MSNTVRNIFLSFSLLLAFFSLQLGVSEELQAADRRSLSSQDELTVVDSVHYRSPALLQAEEQYGIWQSRPTASLKHVPYGSPALAAKAHEFRLQLLVSHYLQRLRHISPGLTGCDIIFPFHYFW